MNRKLLGVSFAAIFAVGMITAASAGVFGSWVGADGGTVTMKNQNSWLLTATALDTIPEKEDITDLAGFAWTYAEFDLGDGDADAFAVTVHDADLNSDGKNDVRDSLQNKEGLHPHNVALSAGAGSATLCVKEILDAPQAGISTEDDQIEVNVRDSVLLGTFDNGVVGYAIIVEPACAPTVPTGDVVDQDILDDLGLPDGLPLGLVLLD